jgi:hypothetical protein
MLHKMYGLWESSGALCVVPRKLTWDFFRSLLSSFSVAIDFRRPWRRSIQRTTRNGSGLAFNAALMKTLGRTFAVERALTRPRVPRWRGCRATMDRIDPHFRAGRRAPTLRAVQRAAGIVSDRRGGRCGVRMALPLGSNRCCRSVPFAYVAPPTGNTLEVFAVRVSFVAAREDAARWSSAPACSRSRLASPSP